MIQSNELRISNFINVDFQPKVPITVRVNCIDEREGVLVDGIDLDFSFDEIEPIPLTEEWLLRFGFELSHQSVFRKNYELPQMPEIGFDYMPFSVPKGSGQFRHYGRHLEGDLCKYVHQLQNLTFALTSQELTLNTTTETVNS